MEAFRFCKHVMRLPDLDEIIDDPVLSGRVRRMDAARDTIKQSRPLTLAEVKFIEEFMMSDMNVFDRYIAGCVLFAIYSRSRWSDLAFLSDLALDTTETELVELVLRRLNKISEDWLHSLEAGDADAAGGTHLWGDRQTLGS